jgi:hypothetical protein
MTIELGSIFEVYGKISKHFEKDAKEVNSNFDCTYYSPVGPHQLY